MDYHEDTKWLEPYDPGYKRDWIYFTYRNPPQYDTADTPDFYVFESFWTFKQRKCESITEWPEIPLHDTWPWPGKKHYEGPVSYHRLTAEVNVDTCTDDPKARIDRINMPEDVYPVDFNKYAG